MKVIKLNESGYEESALGFSLSYHCTIERSKEILPKYAYGKPGENKFLESIYIWLSVEAPRFWWQEADTYRLSTKQSESTMHTLCKTGVTQDNFEYPLPDIFIELINNAIQNYNQDKSIGIDYIKNLLPEGFLQERIWVLNYKTLQNIYIQRKNHRLPQWQKFLTAVLEQIEHPEFIVKES